MGRAEIWSAIRRSGWRTRMGLVGDPGGGGWAGGPAGGGAQEEAFVFLTPSCRSGQAGGGGKEGVVLITI